MAVSRDQAVRLVDGGAVVGTDGDLGKVGQVFVDDQSGEPAWVTVKTGLFGTKESFVPLDDATVDGNTVRVPYDKSTVKGAPNFDTDAHLSEQEEDQLYDYYSVGGNGYATTTATTTRTAVDTDRRVGDEGYLTRSEEQLHVGTQRVETGRARLRKFIVTEQQTVSVPVTREEVRVIREPLAPGAPVGDVTIGEDAIEVTLSEERPVVQKETVAVERVRLGTEVITEQQTVTAEVRKEQIEVNTVPDAGADTTRRR